ncbi:MAG: HAD family phosphatase [Pseudomonadota bacterium]
MSMPKTVVFDVGQVLLRWDPMPVLEDILGGPAALAAFHEKVDFPAFHGERDRGRTAAEAVADMERLAPEFAAAIGTLYARWIDTIPFAIEESVAVFKKLEAAGLPVYGITNFPDEEWQRTIPAYPFLGRFTDVVVSGAEKMVKPDPAIYELLLERNGLAAESCVFIDDTQKNIDGARAVGMDAIHFTDPCVLAPALRERGLPV